MTVPVPMSRIASDLTATIIVKGRTTFDARVWIGVQILRLAAWIMPIETKIEVR